MLTMLKEWKGDIEIDGNKVSDILSFKPSNSQIHIKLYPNGYKANTSELDSKKAINQVECKTEYKITVKQYMTRKASPEFDFMAKWNNDSPMPMRTMVGSIEKETPGMVYMHLKGKATDREITCTRCGKTLTNPISKKYGIGPECMSKVGIVADIEDVDTIKAKLEEIEWTGWIIKSAITEQEVVE